MQYRRTVFWMKLCANVPLLLRNLNNLHQVGCRINTYAFHTLRLVLIEVLVVELIAMTMALTNQ